MTHPVNHKMMQYAEKYAHQITLFGQNHPTYQSSAAFLHDFSCHAAKRLANGIAKLLASPDIAEDARFADPAACLHTFLV